MVLTLPVLLASDRRTQISAATFMKALTDGLQQDFAIWKNKVHRVRPVLCEADTYLAEYRKWARQFYCHPEGQS